MSAGLYNTFKSGIVPLVSNWKALKLATNEAKLAGTAWELVLDSRAFGLGDIGDDFGRFSDTKLERGLQALSDSFGLVSLMSPWTQAMKSWASAVIGTRMLDATARVAAGKATKADIRNLASVGIDEFLAGKIAQQFKTHGRKEGTVKIADTLAWTDREAIDAFRGALQKEVEIAIVTPGAGDKPLWLSTDLGKLIGQFRSFAFSTTQRVLLRGLQQRDAAALNGAAIMFALGMGVYALKSKVAGIETSDDPNQWVIEGIDRSGLLGVIWDMNGIAEKLTAGVVGTSALTGKTMSRYQTRNAIGALLGPSFGLGADAFTMTSAAAQGEIKMSDIRAARRLLPMQNLFYIRGLLNYGQEEAAEAIEAKN